MSGRGLVGTVGRMPQQGDSPDVFESARRILAARDDELADADRALAEVIAGAHAIAVESIGRIDGIAAGLDALAAQGPPGSPSTAHEVSRQLIAANRDIAAAVSEARAAAHAETAALQALTDRYR